jgi:ubiquinone/menaquinone biosynthesis C-methylase UbiE
MPKLENGLKRMWGTRREIILTENILPHFLRKGNVLDVGCGDGFLAHLLTKQRSNVVGIDISSSKIKYAHGMCSGADFIIADGRFLPFRSESFDVVVCSEVFEHVLNYPLIINEIYRIIRKKGKLLITVPYLMHVHIHTFDEQKISNSLTNCGFTVKRIYGIGFELEGIGKRFPSKLRVFFHQVFYFFFKRANFLLVISYKS